MAMIPQELRYDRGNCRDTVEAVSFQAPLALSGSRVDPLHAKEVSPVQERLFPTIRIHLSVPLRWMFPRVLLPIPGRACSVVKKM